MINFGNLYRIIGPGWFLVAVFLIAGCSGSFERSPGEETIANPEHEKETYHPLGLPQDQQIVPERYPFIAESSILPETADSDSIITRPPESVTVEANDHELYRIQLFTSKTYGPAVQEQRIATEVFDRRVHLSYEVPYYKVRVGDFTTREEAEAYLPAAIEAGYEAAWVVRVIVSPERVPDS